MTDDQINQTIHTKIMGLMDEPLPYISDLNAVHRAEVKVVETSGTTIPLMDAIERQVWPAGSSIWATARQRAEAVLRATGNWIETKE